MRMGGWNANVLMLPVRFYVIFWANIFLETIQIRPRANPQTERWCWGLCQLVVRHLALVRLYPLNPNMPWFLGVRVQVFHDVTQHLS